MKFTTIPPLNKLKAKMVCEGRRYWGSVNQFNNLASFINDFNIDAVYFGNDVINSTTFCTRLLLGNVPRSHGSREEMSDFTRALMVSQNGGIFADHAVWWKTQDGKLIFSAVPYISSEEELLSVFDGIAHEFNFPANVKIKILPDKYHWRHTKDIKPLHYIIYDDRAIQLEDAV